MDQNNCCKIAHPKMSYCRFDPAITFEYGVGGLRIFVPAEHGYINYNLVHSLVERKNCDVWRLGKAFATDDDLKNEIELTPDNAEWDMALKLDGRSDFIGGSVHGDERYTSISACLDGKEVDVEKLDVLTPFDELIITEESVGYDPDDSVTKSVKHFKRYLVTSEGITLDQRVEWLRGYTLGQSYMAMMPPLKTLTDRFYTDSEPDPKVAIDNYGFGIGATAATVYGSYISFSMAVTKYPTLVGGDKFLITDNNGRPYNKMYFVLCKGAEVSKGDIWETTTKYRITNGGIK